MTTTAPPPPAPVQRPAAPAGAALAAVGLGLAGALLVPGGPPGVGVALLAGLGAAVLLRAVRLDRWQRLHLGLAVALAACAALRDAPWLVLLDLLAALLLGALALVPARTWAGVVVAPLQVARRLRPGWLVRGLVPLLPRATAGPARGAVLTGALLLVFGPLLASADAGFARALQALVPRVDGVDLLVGRVVVLTVVAVGVAAAALVLLDPPAEPEVGPADRRLTRTSEWLPPLAALDLLLAAFLLVQGRPTDDIGSTPGSSYADAVHAGFWQLLAVTVLVLAVVAAAARWTTGAPGVRAACAVLCLLTVAVDVSALLRLQAYTDAYGLTRLRIGVAAVCLVLAAVLAAVLLAGAVPGVARALPHVLVALGAVALLGLTLADPDAAVARSALDRPERADVAYLSTLSADAVPGLARLPEPARSCVLGPVAARLLERPWTSANVARSRAADVLATAPLLPCGSR